MLASFEGTRSLSLLFFHFIKKIKPLSDSLAPTIRSGSSPRANPVGSFSSLSEPAAFFPFFSLSDPFVFLRTFCGLSDVELFFRFFSFFFSYSFSNSDMILGQSRLAFGSHVLSSSLKPFHLIRY